MATRSISHSPKMYYIYTITNPITGNIFYIGKSTQPKYRFQAHMRNAREGLDTMPVYDTIRGLLEFGIDPTFAIVDQINTTHEQLAFKLEACWRWIVTNEGHVLKNAKDHGYCSIHQEPEADIKRIKQYALATEDELQEMFEVEMREASRLSFDF